jgi:hypothetical protein
MVVTWKSLVEAIEQNPEIENASTEPPIPDDRSSVPNAEVSLAIYDVLGSGGAPVISCCEIASAASTVRLLISSF